MTQTLHRIDQPVTSLLGVGPALAKRLERIGIHTLRDFVWYFPRQYEDRSVIRAIADVTPETKVTISARITQIRSRRAFRRRRMHIIDALLCDDSGSIKAVWFNQPYLAEQLRAGDQFLFSGTAKTGKYGLVLQSPVYELSAPGKQTTHTGRIVPNYALTEGITQKQLRSLVKRGLDIVLPSEDSLPEELLKRYDLSPLSDALYEIHFPTSDEQLARARKRFEFEELYLIQLHVQHVRAALRSHAAPAIAFNEIAIKAFVKQLPFTLTTAQRKAAWAILKDLQHPVPMNRLLSGDVGSGKTVVAAIAILNTILSSHQAVVMVPTEILAQQHAKTLKALFQQEKISVELLTSGTRNKQVAAGADVIIGTHAVIQKTVSFSRLGLVVVDEQHRFGVAQRKALKEKMNGSAVLPHLLSMTATPIPRTLALTAYGDLDLSIIDELPKGRQPILTRLVPPEKRSQAYEFIRRRVANGEQCFIICPLIEESDTLGVKSVTAEYDRIHQEIFPDLRVALIHGKMKTAEKDAVMQQMRAKEVDLLIATSVIEVGVDIPDATLMLIEGSECFGLAQLHQFRGRVGRSDKKSYCLLFTNSNSPQTLQRLTALTATQNGFALAELDLQMRGAGALFGTLQSGFDYATMITFQNPQLIAQAQEAAKDTEINGWLERYLPLQQRFNRFLKAIHQE